MTPSSSISVLQGKMANMKASLCLIVVAALASAMTASAGKAHIVGGVHGWKPTDNPHFFDQWAKDKVFQPGDMLEFHFHEPGSNVQLTDERGYSACKTWEYDAQVKDTYHRSPLVFELTIPGDYYFKSGIGRQCEAGLKLHVHVTQ